MFYHNHRIFHKRCKRAGKAPIEWLTGKNLDKSWIDLLMDRIQAAFQQYHTTSLKELHAQLCPKKQQQQQQAQMKVVKKLQIIEKPATLAIAI